MAERLSERLTNQLSDYLNDAAQIQFERVAFSVKGTEFADNLLAEHEEQINAIKEKHKDLFKQRFEAKLEKSARLLHDIDTIRKLQNFLSEVYPRHKVSFENVTMPWPITDISRFIDHLERVCKQIKDFTFTGGLKKLTGWDGWKTNNEAAGELWLQLDDALDRLTKEEEALEPDFQKYLNTTLSPMIKKEQDKVDSEFKQKLATEKAKTDKFFAELKAREQKLMGDSRISAVEKELQKVEPMLGDPDGWLHYTPATELPPELIIAKSLTLAEDFGFHWHPQSKLSPGEYFHTFSSQFSFYNPKVQGFVMPETFLVDYYLILWAETDDDVTPPAGLYRDIVLRQMRFMPLKSTRSFFIDPKGLGKNMRDLIKLTKEQGGCGVCSLVTQSDDISKTMAQLREYVTKVRQTLTVTGMIDTTQYNAQPKFKEKLPYTTLVIHDFPYGFSTQALDDLHTLLEQANACGFTILISRSKNDPINDNAKELFYNCEKGRRLEYRGEKCVYHDGDFQVLMRRMEVAPTDEFFDDFNAAYSYRPPIKNGFFDHMDAGYLQKPFQGSAAKEIRFPFAIDSQGNPQDLVLDSDLKSYGLIIGGTGAGKTSLLHTIINSAALHYSPRELEMWLIDYKLTSFDFYKRNPLPHLRHIVMDESDVLTYSVVDELRIEYALRQRLFKKAGAKDFEDYRAKGHSLARLLVLVDETHLMSQALSADPDYKLQMKNIISQARYTGINILFSDQKYSALGGFSDCLGDMYVRISLKNAIEQVKDTLGVYNLSTLNAEISQSIQSMPAAAAGTMIYKHEERNPDDPKTKLVHYDHISSLYAPTNAFVDAIRAVNAKAEPGNYPCEIYEGATRLTYSTQSVDYYEQRNPMKPNEGDRFYIGSPRGMGKCFSFSLKSEDEGENILMVGGQNELRGPLVANTIRNALRHDYHVVVLVPRASMFYKKNKEFVIDLAEEFGQQVEFYTEYPEICRYIGLKANALKSLENDESDDFPESERTFIVCLGSDDLYKKMEDDANTQAKAWATLADAPSQEEAVVQLPPQPVKKTSVFRSLDYTALMNAVDQGLEDSDEEAGENTSESPNRYANTIAALGAFMNRQPAAAIESDDSMEPLGAPGTPFPATCPKSIGSTEGLQGYNATKDLSLLIRDGWKLGYHTLLSVNSANGLKNMSLIKLSGNFNHRIALPMAAEQAGSFLYYTKALKNMADEGDQISVVYEYMGGNGQRFIPYL